jgi:hypothetical protein
MGSTACGSVQVQQRQSTRHTKPLDTQQQILSESEVAVLAATDELYSKTDFAYFNPYHPLTVFPVSRFGYIGRYCKEVYRLRFYKVGLTFSLYQPTHVSITYYLPDPHPVILPHRRLGQPLSTSWAACYLVSVCLTRLLPVEVETQHPLVHLAHYRPVLVSTGFTRRYHRLAHLPLDLARPAADGR